MHLKDILNSGIEVTASILIVVTIFWYQTGAWLSICPPTLQAAQRLIPSQARNLERPLEVDHASCRFSSQPRFHHSASISFGFDSITSFIDTSARACCVPYSWCCALDLEYGQEQQTKT